MSDLRNTRTADHLQHIRDVIREQFGSELSYKEGELEQIEERIRLAKLMLQRLRFGVLAQHYGVAGFYPTALDFSEENVGEQSSWMSFEQEFLKRSSPEKEDANSVASGAAGGAGDGDERAVCADGSDRRTPVQSIGEASSYLRREYGPKKEFVLGPVPVKKPEIAPPLVVKDTSQSTDRNDVGDGRTGMIITNSNGEVPDNQLMLTQSINEAPQSTPPSDIHATPTSPKQVSRFYSKQRIIIGNTSQYLHPASSEENANGSTHKWMVYVRGPNEDADISKFVKAVRFFLHPSYHPNDIVRVTRPPFHLIRLGWGEFPVRVQLEFCDRRNKPVDIIHNLVLDRTHTGQQTLGAETVVDLDINPNRKEGLSLVGGANGLSHPLLNGHLATDEDNISPAPANDVGKLSIGQNMIKSLSREESLVNMKMATIEEERDADLISRTDDKLSTHSAKSSECNDSYQAGSSSHLEAPSLTTPSATPTILDALPPQVMTTNLEKCLHSAVRVVPLYGRPSGSDDFHLTACTVDQFKSWSVGRRRAAEWMRALAVKRHVERKLRLTTSLLSTKQVMQWCRRNGYTLLDPCTPTGVGFCKYCGCQLEATGSLAVGGSEETKAEEEKRNLDHLRVHERCREIYEGGSGLNESASVDMEIDSETEGAAPLEERPATTMTPFKRLSSLSESQELFVNLIQAQERIEKAEAGHVEEDEVDIETQPGCTSARARAYEHPVPRLRVPQTPELKWVQRTASSIGIHIYPAVIDRMYAHVVEHMVYMSCTRFLKAILMQSLQEAGRKVEGDLSSERVLTPLHVYQAVQSLHQCDFLTNKHLGLEVKGRGIVGGASDEELSSSCSSSDDDA